MALINCPNCGQQISEHAKQCIHCGYMLDGSDNIQNITTPVPKKKGSKSKIVLLIVVSILILIGASVGITLIVINGSSGKFERCKYEGCDNKVYSDGYCIDHYKSAREEDRDNNETSKSDLSDDVVEEDKVEITKFRKDEKISSDTCEFTFTGYSIAKKIEPKNVTDSYVYHYFEASTGNQFIDIKFKIKNKRNSDVDQDEVLDSVKVIYDGEFEYRCQFVTVDKDNDFQQYTSLYSISPLETMEYHMLSEVPDEVKTSDKSLVVQVTADGNVYECKLR